MKKKLAPSTIKKIRKKKLAAIARQDKRLKKYYEEHPEEKTKDPRPKRVHYSASARYLKKLEENPEPKNLDQIKERLRLDREKHLAKPEKKIRYYGPCVPQTAKKK